MTLPVPLGPWTGHQIGPDGACVTCAGSGAEVAVVNGRGAVIALYPHPTVTGPVTLAAYCPNALQIEEYDGGRDTPALAGTCGLVGPDGEQCIWTSESHLTRDSVEFVWAGHVAEEHKDGES